MTYEGGASINGPVPWVARRERRGREHHRRQPASVLGYSLRSVAGYVADRTGKHWPITFLGYAVNLFAVPAMALAGSWHVAAALILAERVGRAMRKPTVEAMLWSSTGTLGRGWVYALNTALDETGATLGPLLIALVLFLKAAIARDTRCSSSPPHSRSPR